MNINFAVIQNAEKLLRYPEKISAVICADWHGYKICSEVQFSDEVF